MTWHHPDGTSRRPPVFNAPRAVVWLAGTLLLVHLLKVLAFSDRLILSLAFIPARFSAAADAAQGVFVGGALSKWTSLVTHVFLHGGWWHLLFNSVWLLIFGTPVAARLGTARFLTLFLLTGIAGAATHGVLSWVGDAFTGGPRGPEILVGASGAISGLMGAAARFIVLGREMAVAGYDRPLLPLNDNQVVTFTVLWVVINLVLALTGGLGMGMGDGISWEAHLGGYFAGLFLIPFIDSKGRAWR
ncbi:MAG: rhomboid family intramembrane serine protease [Alphaproteobacteria bacterium]